jgi:hypothetical protein
MSIAVQQTTTGAGNAEFQVALEQVLGAGSEEQEGGSGQTVGRCGGCGHCGCGHCGCGHCGCGHCGCGHCGCGHCGCGHCGCR